MLGRCCSATLMMLAVGCVQGLNVTDDHNPRSVLEFHSDEDGKSYTTWITLKYDPFDDKFVTGFTSHAVNTDDKEVSRVNVTFAFLIDAALLRRDLDQEHDAAKLSWITNSPLVFDFWTGWWPSPGHVSVHVYGVSLEQFHISRLRSDWLTGLDLTGNSWATTSGLTLEMSLLKELRLSNNQIEEIHEDLLKSCPHLEVLDLSRNKIKTFPDNYIRLVAATLLKLNMSHNQISSVYLDFISKYIEVDLSFNNIFMYHHPGYSFKVDRVVLAGQNISSMSEVGTILSNIDSKSLENPASNVDLVYYDLNSKHPLYVPDSECNVNKKYVSCKQKGSRIFLRPDSWSVNLSGNPIASDGSSSLEMRAEKHVDLSRSHLKILDEDVPWQISRTEQLNLSRNSISYISKYFFKNMTRLTVLDLSHNRLKQVELILYSSLFMLDISKNDLDRITISHSPSNYTTKYLNLSHNSFSNILKDEWSQFEQFSKVDLGQNNLQCCGADGYYSRTMLLHYQNKILNINSTKPLSCVKPINRRVEMTKEWLSEDHCQNLFQGWVAFGCLLLVSPLVITAIDLLHYYTHQTERDLAHHLTHVKKQGLEQDERHALECEYDAFVCHSHQAASWVSKELVPNLENDRDGHRLCIHYRDFPLGSLIEENIETAMDKSRKVIVVVSRAFLKSYWCKMELTFAWTKMVSEGRNFIIVIELDKIPKGKRPPILSFLMESRTYLEWPEESTDVVKQECWSRVRDALGKSLRRRQQEQSKRARRRNCTQTATEAFIIDC